jgi:hypothetical protein
VADVVSPAQILQNGAAMIPTDAVIVPPPSATRPPAPLTLPYALNTSTSNETYWPKAWGTISFVKNSIVFAPDPSTHGANSFLGGASSWTNYTVNANARSLMGGWFDIVARVASGTQDFVYCEFGSNGTEIIERVHGADTQLAFAAASTTDTEGAGENFGMTVYGNDISCVMAGREVIGVRVNNNESPAGGIGFVVFGQPPQQKSVTISNVSVSVLASDTIVAPFPMAATAPPPSIPIITPPTPALVSVTTTLSLPYSTSVFNAVDWGQGWGSFSPSPTIMSIGSNSSTPSGGIFLLGSNSWVDYKFTAYVEWVSGQVFELVARRTDGANLLECIFSSVNAANTNISINMVSGGQTTILNQGEELMTPAAHMFSVGFPVSMEAQGLNIRCDVDNQSVVATMNGNILPRGGIGFITWDPQQNNSEIRVTHISVVSL